MGAVGRCRFEIGGGNIIWCQLDHCEVKQSKTWRNTSAIYTQHREIMSFFVSGRRKDLRCEDSVRWRWT